MTYVLKLFIAFHVFSAVFWVSTTILVAFLWFPLLQKYDSLTGFANFRLEWLQQILKWLNGVFILALFSGVAIIFITHKSVVVGLYGFFFTSKMLLLLIHFFLLLPYFRLPTQKNQPEATDPKETVKVLVRVSKTRAFLLLFNGVILVILGIALGHFRTY